MKTKLEIINETVEYYSTAPLERRAFSNDICVYRDLNGNMCALGRYINPQHPKTQEAYNFRGGAARFFGRFGVSILKPDSRHNDITFWSDLQLLHDNNENWTTQGLSPFGRQKVSALQTKYANS